MNDLPRDKYEILDIIFIFLNTLCLILTIILILSNLIVSWIYTIEVVLLAIFVLYLWISRNPFNIYLIRALAFNNFIFTFIALILFYSKLSTTLTEDQIAYAFLLIPSVIYLIISYKFSAITTLSDKKEGKMLALVGIANASQRRLFRDNREERIKREELFAQQKEKYRYKIIIVLTIVLSLSSIAALIFGFY